MTSYRFKGSRLDEVETPAGASGEESQERDARWRDSGVEDLEPPEAEQAGASEDSVRMYLTEMGSVPLLKAKPVDRNTMAVWPD